MNAYRFLEIKIFFRISFFFITVRRLLPEEDEPSVSGFVIPEAKPYDIYFIDTLEIYQSIRVPSDKDIKPPPILNIDDISNAFNSFLQMFLNYEEDCKCIISNTYSEKNQPLLFNFKELLQEIENYQKIQDDKTSGGENPKSLDLLKYEKIILEIVKRENLNIKMNRENDTIKFLDQFSKILHREGQKKDTQAKGGVQSSEKEYVNRYVPYHDHNYYINIIPKEKENIMDLEDSLLGKKYKQFRRDDLYGEFKVKKNQNGMSGPRINHLDECFYDIDFKVSGEINPSILQTINKKQNSEETPLKQNNTAINTNESDECSSNMKQVTSQNPGGIKPGISSSDGDDYFLKNYQNVYLIRGNPRFDNSIKTETTLTPKKLIIVVGNREYYLQSAIITNFVYGGSKAHNFTYNLKNGIYYKCDGETIEAVNVHQNDDDDSTNEKDNDNNEEMKKRLEQMIEDINLRSIFLVYKRYKKTREPDF